MNKCSTFFMFFLLNSSSECCPQMVRLSRHPWIPPGQQLVQPQNYAPLKDAEQIKLSICLPYNGSQVQVWLERRPLDYIVPMYPPHAALHGSDHIPRYEGGIIDYPNSFAYGTLYDGVFIGDLKFRESWCDGDSRRLVQLRSTKNLLEPKEFAHLEAKIGGSGGFHSYAVLSRAWNECRGKF